MKNTEKKGKKEHICVGLLAHVDAGKTTLAESILYVSGKTRTLGRVDHGNAYLDTFELERVDFSAEMEQTLQVLDYAILVIGGADGVQGHVQTLWHLLKRYEIPTFLFVNKMDQSGTDKETLLAELQNRLSASCIDFTCEKDSEAFLEAVAMCDEEVLENYLEGEPITDCKIRKLIQKRKIFPCYFGSALKLEGIDTFFVVVDR